MMYNGVTVLKDAVMHIAHINAIEKILNMRSESFLSGIDVSENFSEHTELAKHFLGFAIDRQTNCYATHDNLCEVMKRCVEQSDNCDLDPNNHGTTPADDMGLSKLKKYYLAGLIDAAFFICNPKTEKLLFSESLIVLGKVRGSKKLEKVLAFPFIFDHVTINDDSYKTIVCNLEFVTSGFGFDIVNKLSYTLSCMFWNKIIIETDNTIIKQYFKMNPTDNITVAA